MIYCMSDLHGCYRQYLAMLEKIGFSDEDTLYILGDTVDRGPSGIKILQNMMQRKKVICLRGNHDQEAMVLLSAELHDPVKADYLQEVKDLWFRDGGETTYQEFIRLSDEEKKAVLLFMNSMPLLEEITVERKKFSQKHSQENPQKFLLSHTVPSKAEMTDLESCLFSDFLVQEPEYDQVYFEDIIIVTGHTPTGFIDPSYAGRIWRGNNHIALDCGCVFGNPLGCICLDTGEEFYV